MNRLLYFGCTPGNDVASMQNDLNLISGHTQQGSSMAALAVDGIFGSKSQSRVLEFQRINGLGADGVVGEQTLGKIDQLFLSQPGLQIKRIRGGVAGSDAGLSKDKSGGSYGKVPSTGAAGTKSGGAATTGTSWGKSVSGPGGQGKTVSNFGFKGS